MKKLLLILLAIAFAVLFYKQSLGLNALLFVPAILYAVTPKTFTFNVYGLALITCAIAVFIQPSGASIFVLLLSLVVYIGKTHLPNLAVYLAAFNGLINAMVGGIDYLSKQKKNTTTDKKSINGKFWFITTIIIIPVFLIFVLLYRDSNPVFDKLISKIDLSFINIGFVFTSLLGFAFLYNIKHPVLLSEMQEIENNTPTSLTKPLNDFTNSILEKLKHEHLQASLLIGILNFLLVLFLITDVILYTDAEAFQNFSQNVHSSVNTLIISILLAITIISIYFRGNLNFYQDNTTLKRLTYTWLLLNAILVISTMYKNYMYLYYYGLTYKRIGVFVYLFLVIVGLWFTYSKIQTQKTIWFLLKKSSVVGFFMFVVLSLIPYSKVIAYYNIHYAIHLDMKYVLSLPNDNAFILWDNKDKISQKTDKDYSQTILRRATNYQKELTNKQWQSLKLDSFIYASKQ